jgi:formate-dependent nitrite reductase membrane component NrfD
MAGSLLSPVLLIADLKTPSRWYNMLRLYRATSPMSIGSWTLLLFGSFSGLAALGQLGADLLDLPAVRRLARWAGLPAAAAGALLATYTGTLLAATSTPFWAVAYRLLPPLFGLSGTATATAALALLLPHSTAAQSSRRRIERLALVASAAELLLVWRLERLWRRHDLHRPLEAPPFQLAYRLGALGLGIVCPLVIHLLQVLSGRELRALGTFAALSALVGGYCQRAVLILAGKRSADDPHDAFRLAQPAHEAELAPAPGGRRA